MSKMLEVSRFSETFEDYILDLSRIVAYSHYNWISGVLSDELRLTYPDVLDSNEFGEGLRILFKGDGEFLHVKDFIIPEDDEKGKQWIKDFVEKLDLIFINSSKVRFVGFMGGEKLRNTDSFALIGGSRIDLKYVVSVYPNYDVNVYVPDFLGYSSTIVPYDEGMVFDVFKSFGEDTESVDVVSFELSSPLLIDNNVFECAFCAFLKSGEGEGVFQNIKNLFLKKPKN